MIRYLSFRIIRSIMTLAIIIILVFILLRKMPIEGYFQNYDKLSEEQINTGLNNMGLNDPIHLQLFRFFNHLMKGDLGTSQIYRANVPINKIIAKKIPVSLKLGTISVAISLFLGVFLGIFMAGYKGQLFDHLGTGFIVLIEAVPAAIIFLMIQIYGTKWFHIHLLYDAYDNATLILPVISLSLGNTAFYAIWIRRYMVDESTKDYVQLARAKGLSNKRIMVVHIFRNAIIPMTQYLPTTLLNTAIGSIYIESIYSIPGMGGLLVDVIKRQDNTMVQAIVILYAIIGIFGLIIGDILMSILDPRICLSNIGESHI